MVLQIQSGQVLKISSDPLPVNFFEPFTTDPVVFLTPSFTNNPITFVDSVINVTPTGFTIISPNAANDYFLNWVAMTPGAFKLIAD